MQRTLFIGALGSALLGLGAFGFSAFTSDEENPTVQPAAQVQEPAETEARKSDRPTEIVPEPIIYEFPADSETQQPSIILYGHVHPSAVIRTRLDVILGENAEDPQGEIETLLNLAGVDELIHRLRRDVAYVRRQLSNEALSISSVGVEFPARYLLELGDLAEELERIEKLAARSGIADAEQKAEDLFLLYHGPVLYLRAVEDTPHNVVRIVAIDSQEHEDIQQERKAEIARKHQRIFDVITRKEKAYREMYQRGELTREEAMIVGPEMQKEMDTALQLNAFIRHSLAFKQYPSEEIIQGFMDVFEDQENRELIDLIAEDIRTYLDRNKVSVDPRSEFMAERILEEKENILVIFGQGHFDLVKKRVEEGRKVRKDTEEPPLGDLPPVIVPLPGLVPEQPPVGAEETLTASSSVAGKAFVHPFSGIKYTQLSESVLHVPSKGYWNWVLSYAYDGQEFSDRKRLAEQAHDLLLVALPGAMLTKAEAISIEAQITESSWVGGVLEKKNGVATLFRKSSAGSWIAKDENDPGANTFFSRYLGFSITKPPSWSFDLSRPQSATNVLNMKKHPSRYHGLNTLVEVHLGSKKNIKKPIVEALGQHAERAARQLMGRVSAKAHPVELGGRQWYVAIVEGRVDADGEQVELEAQMWRTTHNGAYYVFNFNGPANETARDEFAQIRQSIEFLQRTPPYADGH